MLPLPLSQYIPKLLRAMALSVGGLGTFAAATLLR